MATRKRFAVDAPVEELLVELAENGGAIVDGFLSKAALERFNSEIDPHLAAKAASQGTSMKGSKRSTESRPSI
jgi:hypothetical protein